MSFKLALDESCKNVLTQNIEVSSLNRTQQLAWLSMVSEKDYQANSTEIEAGASILGIGGSGSYKEFDTRRREYLGWFKYNFGLQESINLYSAKVTPNQVNAWLACMQGKDFRGAAGMVTDYDDFNVFVKFYYRPQAGQQPAHTLQVKVTNGDLAPGITIPASVKEEANYVWQFSRADKDKNFWLVVNLNGNSAFELKLPAYAPPRQEVIGQSDWTYLVPRIKDPQPVGETREGEVGFLVMAGEWGPWGSGGKWFLPETCCMSIQSQNRNTGVLEESEQYRKPYIRINPNRKVIVVVQDSGHKDNVSKENNPLRAKIFLGLPPI